MCRRPDRDRNERRSTLVHVAASRTIASRTENVADGQQKVRWHPCARPGAVFDPTEMSRHAVYKKCISRDDRENKNYAHCLVR